MHKTKNHFQKNLLVFFILLISSLPLCAETLEGSISVDSARIDAFDGIEKALSQNELTLFKSDRFYYSNMDLIKSGKYMADFGYERKITPYFTKRNRLIKYSVQYRNASKKTLYYSKRDKLLRYEITDYEGFYPYKTAVYNSRGKLSNIDYIISDNEKYIFNKKKKLIAYCINDKCYNEKGKRKKIKQ